MPSFSALEADEGFDEVFTAGITRSSSAQSAEMYIAVGKVSFDDRLMLMSSFGWSSFFPAISFARFAMTSFAFMLD